MRRLAIIVLLLIAAPVTVAVATAGAEDKRTYRVEFDNAFGLVEGSDVNIAGVKAGSIKALDINRDKRAEATIEVSGPYSELTDEAHCSSEPQSLIAEYFITCQPGKGERLKENGVVPVENTEITVQPDLVQNSLREPFKRRLQLIINEFGTGLAGRPQDLNDAIRRGAPAIRDTRKVLAILGRQNRVIRDLNVDSDEIIGELADNREDVNAFIEEANETAQASAERNVDIKASFNKLPDFLEELRPTMRALGEVADEQTPLLNDLRTSAGQLNRLTRTVPPFARATTPSLRSLGGASVKGRRALRKGRDEIRQLQRSTRRLPGTADELADFTTDLHDRSRAVEEDYRSPGGKGYTGMEGLLNYVYYQTGAINQFDQVGYLLHFVLLEIETGKCAEFATKPARAAGGALERCVSWLGPNQPGITEPSPTKPYDPRVCDRGSDDPELCNPAGGNSSGRQKAQTPTLLGGADEGLGGLAPPPTPEPQSGGGGGGKRGIGLGTPKLPGPLQDLLGTPDRLPLQGGRGGRGGDDLLDFLLGS